MEDPIAARWGSQHMPSVKIPHRIHPSTKAGAQFPPNPPGGAKTPFNVVCFPRRASFWLISKQWMGEQNNNLSRSNNATTYMEFAHGEH